MTADGPAPNPTTLRLAVGLIMLEAAAVAVVTAYLLWQDLTGRATVMSVAIGVTLFAAIGVVVLAAVGRALARRRSGARGPAVVLQLMVIVIGYYMTQGGLVWPGVGLIVLGLVTGGLVVSPPTTRALGLG
ncbi:hypothetical protein [Spirilliplanes yamanashiensis]|uniref:Integral membrane protein n=1 Tax=Spirilliplanes yamanashiensis TaxID=42233 RepID=A0A8J3Y3M7_9ACTN|nr:hypothetical protein [Spirilliplanes yamanashiensis]MDP9820109.1 peptidoglycan/LPS O-acetylase OafA/YrhL [Spirilliplanes yamanashiensis]GIJ01071.1 hypothetical protein Sya03_04230 [Spirilliplanes yamanashiensis]